MHLVGHSLGAHLMGKAGRCFHEIQGQKIGRITGLDPAGLRFTSGPLFEGKRILALPELRSEMLSKESATFVDVIHTDGGHAPCIFCLPKFGTLQPMGHYDFYPQGGSDQPGCLLGVDTQEEGVPVACSHSRVLKYFLHSILQRQLFPVVDCPSMKHCSSKALITGAQAEKIFMGEAAAEGFDGSVRMFFTNIEDCHWDYIEHNNYHIVNICVGRDAEQVNMGDPRR